MATYEKRSYIKEYDVTGKLLSKIAYEKEVLLAEEVEEVEEDLFGNE